MTELKTLKDIRRMPFETKRGIHQDDLKQAAKEHMLKLCKDMKLDAKKIRPGHYDEKGIFCFVYEQPADEHKLIDVGMVAWIKYFFNLE
ncbi:MAG: hypothetical protein KAS32_13755 [Candidatus Peribacteraceae bacterium]|nr:hypothetical protein [Candidatus Peribacteraceae bacterium]